jgi:hypothetical protein
MTDRIMALTTEPEAQESLWQGLLQAIGRAGGMRENSFSTSTVIRDLDLVKPLLESVVTSLEALTTSGESEAAATDSAQRAAAWWTDNDGSFRESFARGEEATNDLVRLDFGKLIDELEDRLVSLPRTDVEEDTFTRLDCEASVDAIQWLCRYESELDDE